MELTPATVRLPKDLDPASVAALCRDFEAALASEAPVVAFTGAEADTFCLGMAIGSSLGGSATRARSRCCSHACTRPRSRCWLSWTDARSAAAWALACACDWVVATNHSTFALPELLWGLVPAIIWPVITSRMAPHVARQWTISAHTRTASDGLGAGLVDDVTTSDRARSRRVERAVLLASAAGSEALCRFRAWARRRGTISPEALRIGADITADMVRQPSVRPSLAGVRAGRHAVVRVTAGDGVAQIVLDDAATGHALGEAMGHALR